MILFSGLVAPETLHPKIVLSETCASFSFMKFQGAQIFFYHLLQIDIPFNQVTGAIPTLDISLFTW
jgi:hypothetical protein